MSDILDLTEKEINHRIAELEGYTKTETGWVSKYGVGFHEDDLPKYTDNLNALKWVLMQQSPSILRDVETHLRENLHHRPILLASAYDICVALLQARK